MCRNRGIGYNNALPFHFKKDLQYFSRMTTGGTHENNCILMGRKTWESLPYKPLKNRENIVITRDDTIPNSFRSVDKSLEYCREKGFDNVWVIGGSSIYEHFLRHNLAKWLYVTKIDGDYECDTFFPEIGKEWELVSSNKIVERNAELDFQKYKMHLR